MGNHLWSKRFGDGEAQLATKVAVAPQGGVYIGGLLHGTVDFGGQPLTSAGGGDVCVARFDASGNHVWSKRFGDSAFDTMLALASTPTGGVVIGGSFDGTIDFGGGILTSQGSDIFVAALDANGNHLWSQRYGDSMAQQVRDVDVDAAGNVLITGYFEGAVDFGGGPISSVGGYDAFVAKLSSSGNQVWSRGFGDADIQTGYGVGVDAAGNSVAVGEFRGTVGFGGPSFTATNDDGYIVRSGP